jgi:hypothetical protein
MRGGEIHPADSLRRRDRGNACEPSEEVYNSALLTEDDKKWIASQISASEERVGARMEKIETTLLTEFHKWAGNHAPAQSLGCAANHGLGIGSSAGPSGKT